MPKTPARLVGPELLTDTAAEIYVSPVDTQTVVRHLHVFNGSAVPVTLTLSIGTDAAGTRLYDEYEIPSRQPFSRFCLHVLEAGETIEASAGTDGELVIELDGDLITA